MDRLILSYLKNYSTEVTPINRLLISTFLNLKSIKEVNNLQIQSLIITDKKSDEWMVLNNFLALLKTKKQKICFEELLELFEFVISPSDKLVNGAIYTPKNIRDYITIQSFNSLNKDTLNDVKVADIACGCGGFLINASQKIKKKTNKSFKNIFKENIFGVDIQGYSIERTKILLSLLAITKGEDELNFEFNLHTGNSLKFDWSIEEKNFKGFDLILGNPPYVYSRNMDKQTKELVRNWSVCSTGHPDLYIPFFQIGYELLNKNGILGFITVNTFTHSVNGRALRGYFSNNNVSLKIIDFKDEQIFKSKMAYTCICFLQKKASEYIYYSALSSNSLVAISLIKFNKNLYKELSAPLGWNIRNNKLIKKLESIGTKFGDKYNTKSGIATLRNKVYIFNPVKTNSKYFYMEDGTAIEKDICKDIVNSNKLNKTNNIENLMEKIIFPYRYNKNNMPYIIEEEVLSEEFPKAYQYLYQHKKELQARDKGKGKYPTWYAFGRTQSLEKIKNKLLFPRMVKKGFVSEINNDENLYFYNGMSAYNRKNGSLEVLQKILCSKIAWMYIENKCKYYVSGYFGLGKNYLDNFGIYNFNEKDIELLVCKKNINKSDTFIAKKYKFTSSD
ncbi:Putative type IIS restriction /modification enzyme, N-terminal half [uncultured Candidatus Thioglobus sp.]|nr:Putative type IIS restriction /modification enzyme, N-terminal half [uncultured Candidatus Thioglobus sp.]